MDANHDLDPGCIGGSDVAAALGISPFKNATPVSLWARLTNVRQGIEWTPTPPTEPMEWGTKLEPVILDEVAHRTEMVCSDQVDENRIDLSVFDWPARVTPDALANVPGDHNYVLVEAKTSNAFAESDWRQGVPPYYLCQVDYYMAALRGVERAIVAVLIGGNTFRMFRVERNRDREQAMLARVGEFWQSVVNRELPPPIGEEDLRILYPVGDGGKEAHGTDRDAKLAEHYRALSEAMEPLKAKKDDIATALKARMGEATSLVVNGEKIATWSAGSDVASRRFNVPKRKS